MADFISTGVLSLDCALGGGYPKNGIAEIYGEMGAGRLTLALHAIAECQLQPDGVTFMFAHGDQIAPFDAVYGMRLGVDPQRFLHFEQRKLELLFRCLRSAVTGSHPPDLVIVDLRRGIARLSAEEGSELVARLSLFLREHCSHKQRTSLLFLSDGKLQPLQFHAQQRILLQFDRVAPNDDTLVHANIVKNRLGEPYKQLSLQLTPGDGVDLIADIVRTAAYAGVLPHQNVEALCVELRRDNHAREALCRTVRSKMLFGASVAQ